MKTILKTIKKMFTYLMAMLMILSFFTTTSVASAANSAQDSVPPVQGPTVKADPNSPTGYTVTFVYYNPNATQVRLAGDLTLRGIGEGTTRFQPEAWQTGRYHAGGVEFLRDMTKDADGYWSVSIPLHAGGLSYWYRVWDPTQSWTNRRIWDPAGTHPRPTVDPNNATNSTPFRIRNNNDVLDAVYVPYAEKQNDPVLETRAIYELPIADPAQRGTVQYIPYTTILGGVGFHLGVYLPAGYDANRAEPYKVVYLAHGVFGDETDFMIPINVPPILDNMIARGEIEPTVAVTMGNHFTGTSLGFGSYNQQNAANNLVQTILPLIEANYNVSNKQEGRAYGGFSMGGFTGGNVMNTYPTAFGFYGFFSGNGSFTATQYNNIAALTGTNNLFVFLGNGVFEGSLNAQNTIANNFRTRGIPAETAQVPGAHDGMTAGQLFTIFARDYLWTNYPPVWTATIGDKSVDENRTLTFTVPAAADTTGTVLTYTTDPLPAGASFNPETQEFTWTPDYTQAGEYPIVFYVSDGENVVSKGTTITVNDVLVTDQIAGLKATVAGLSINGGLKNAFTVKLDQVLKLLSNDNPSEAVQVLNGFIGQANDLRDEGKLTAAQAAELINAAQETILNIMQNN
jgi:enterochelin esterase-like enzyme